jgi:hypothetical protein
MKLGCIITNRRVKLRVWVEKARHNPWLKNSNSIISRQDYAYTFFGGGDMEGAIFV